MADMFSRLAERATGTGTITPRLPARFEGETSLEAEETTTAQSPTTVDRGPRSVEAAAPREPESNAPKASGFEVSESVPAAEVRPMPAPLLMPTPLPTQPRVAEVSEPAPSRRATVKAMVSQSNDESRVRPAPVADGLTTATHHVSTVETRSVETRESRRAGQMAQATAVQQPRPVHITIGRIEVRAMPAAVQQAAPVPQVQDEPQGLTLSQYLRGDDGRPA